MAYQYVREPLRAQEADALSHACETRKRNSSFGRLSTPAFGCPSSAVSPHNTYSGSRKRCGFRARGGRTANGQKIAWCPCPGAFNP